MPALLANHVMNHVGRVEGALKQFASILLHRMQGGGCKQRTHEERGDGRAEHGDGCGRTPNTYHDMPRVYAEVPDMTYDI